MSAKPLTLEQQNWLKANATLPAIFLFVLLTILCGMFACLFTGLRENLPFIIFLAVSGLLMLAVLAATSLHIYNNLMDLRSGAAQVLEARLAHKRHTSRSPKTFYAEFEGIGSVIIMGDVYETLEEGKIYRVAYSPKTRRGWEIDALP